MKRRCVCGGIPRIGSGGTTTRHRSTRTTRAATIKAQVVEQVTHWISRRQGRNTHNEGRDGNRNTNYRPTSPPTKLLSTLSEHRRLLGWSQRTLPESHTHPVRRCRSPWLRSGLRGISQAHDDVLLCTLF